MNIELLQNWLSLPPGPWPPDDRTLLGLPPGPLTAVDVELRALAQMEKLRTHQLMHGDLVTEGMNRLAQSLITLTDEANQAQKPAPRGPLIDAAADLILDADQLAGTPAKPVVLEAEVVAGAPRMADRIANRNAPKPVRKPLKKKRKPRNLIPEAPPVDIPVIEPIPPGTDYLPAQRREGYRKLVSLRRVLQDWERLQPYFSAPSESLNSASAIFGFVDSVKDCRRRITIDGDSEWFEKHGQKVIAVVRNPLALPIFRSLLHKQRQELATDWAYTTARLRALYRGMRNDLRESKPRNKWGYRIRQFRDWLRSNPEWLMAILMVLAIVIAFIRSTMRATGAESAN